jgi:pilus assembly protein Flp/PilA
MLRRLSRGLVNFLKAEDGPTAVEYAVMLALVIVVCSTAALALGNQIDELFEVVTSALK